ncbi:MAG: hypothetical protein R2939_19160 [Kofleriaceae bacterium]
MCGDVGVALAGVRARGEVPTHLVPLATSPTLAALRAKLGLATR